MTFSPDQPATAVEPDPATPTIPITSIETGGRLRAIGDIQVEALMSSIRDIGLINPITVHGLPPGTTTGDGIRFGLVAGAHRLEACRRLGLASVPVHILSTGDLEREIIECDENLCGPRLSPAESALLTAKRKRAYEALHPETRNGASGNGRKKGRQLGEATRFTADTAARTGKSERAVQRDAARGTAIVPKILESIMQTELDSGVLLDALAATPQAKQAEKLAEFRARPPARSLHPKQQTGQEARVAESRAAEWLADHLALEALKQFSKLLRGEDPATFVRHLRELIQRRSEAPDPIPAAHDPLVPSAIDIVATEVAPDGAQDSPAPHGCEQVSALSSDEAVLAVVEPIILHATSALSGPQSVSTEPRRRPSNWTNLDDIPTSDDVCRECGGTKWREVRESRSGWYCASCFEPPLGCR